MRVRVHIRRLADLRGGDARLCGPGSRRVCYCRVTFSCGPLNMRCSSGLRKGRPGSHLTSVMRPSSRGAMASPRAWAAEMASKAISFRSGPGGTVMSARSLKW